MTYVWVALAAYLTLGITSVAISYKDLIAPKWWAWLVVVIAWPVWWFHLFRGR
jgi:hypothetical protein